LEVRGLFVPAGSLAEDHTARRIELFSGLFTPTYAIVENQLPKEVAAKISDQPGIFYFQLGVSAKF